MIKIIRFTVFVFLCSSLSSCTILGLMTDILTGDLDFTATKAGASFDKSTAQESKALRNAKIQTVMGLAECIREQDMEDSQTQEKYQETIAQIHAARETTGSTTQSVSGTIYIQMNRERILLASARKASKLLSDSLSQVMGDTLKTDFAWAEQPMPKIFITEKFEKKWLKSEKHEMVAKGKKNGWACSKKEIKEKAQQKVLAHSKIMSDTMEIALRNEMSTRLYKKLSQHSKTISKEYISNIINQWDPSFVSNEMQTRLQRKQEKKKVRKKKKTREIKWW